MRPELTGSLLKKDFVKTVVIFIYTHTHTHLATDRIKHSSDTQKADSVL